MNFCDILFAFLGKSLLCISEKITCDQEGLHQCVNPSIPPEGKSITVGRSQLPFPRARSAHFGSHHRQRQWHQIVPSRAPCLGMESQHGTFSNRVLAHHFCATDRGCEQRWKAASKWGGKLLHTETPLPGANEPICRLLQDVDLFTCEVFSHRKKKSTSMKRMEGNWSYFVAGIHVK